MTSFSHQMLSISTLLTQKIESVNIRTCCKKGTKKRYENIENVFISYFF